MCTAPPSSWRRLSCALAASTLLAGACDQVPFTERTQYNLVPAEILRDLGRTSFETAVQDTRIIKTGREVELLEQVGERIAKVANMANLCDWHIVLLDGNQANAWALPGGYVAFYTGILPALRNEAGMAYVMGHEIGHSVAEHAGERMTQQMTLLGGITVLDMYMTQRSSLSQQQRQLLLAALGLGAEVGLLLPYSRLHEREADVIGMMYMARAGYPPAESLAVWERMAELARVRPPVFISTHPSPEDRQQNLLEWMDQAERKYRRNALDRDTTRTRWPMPGDPEPATTPNPPPTSSLQGR